MMAWIESHQSLRVHPKTVRAVGELRVDRHKFIGHLQCLWWWALDVADYEDGWLPKDTTPESIAIGAEWPLEDASSFVGALLKAGFLESKRGRYKLHDWYDYAGKYNARRVRNREAMRANRVQHVEYTPDERVDLPTLLNSTLPTNQPTGTTNGHQPAKTNPLNLSDDEWRRVQSRFPGVNVQSYWREWVSWIEKSEGRGVSKTPDEKVAALCGFVAKKLSAAPAG